MLGKSGIHEFRMGINVTKENGIPKLWFHVHPGIAKIGMSTTGGNVTIHDHGSHALSKFMRQAGAVTIAMGHVPIGFFFIHAATKVLYSQPTNINQ